MRPLVASPQLARECLDRLTYHDKGNHGYAQRRKAIQHVIKTQTTYLPLVDKHINDETNINRYRRERA